MKHFAALFIVGLVVFVGMLVDPAAALVFAALFLMFSVVALAFVLDKD